jgi:hypothetical protein
MQFHPVKEVILRVDLVLQILYDDISVGFSRNYSLNYWQFSLEEHAENVSDTTIYTDTTHKLKK